MTFTFDPFSFVIGMVVMASIYISVEFIRYLHHAYWQKKYDVEYQAQMDAFRDHHHEDLKKLKGERR